MPPLRHPHPDRRGQGENQTLHEDRHRVLPQTATLTAPSPPDHTRRPSCMRVSRTRFLAPPCAQDCTAFKPTISPTNSADEPEIGRPRPTVTARSSTSSKLTRSSTNPPSPSPSSR